MIILKVFSFFLTLISLISYIESWITTVLNRRENKTNMLFWFFALIVTATIFYYLNIR